MASKNKALFLGPLFLLLILPSILHASNCGPALANDGNKNPSPSASTQKVEISRDDKSDIIEIASDYRSLHRSYTNDSSTPYYENRPYPPDDDKYHKTLDTTDLLKVTLKRSFRAKGDKEVDTWDEDVHLNKTYNSIGRDFNAPLLDSKEIRLRQEAYKELLEDSKVHDSLKEWTDAHEHFIESDRYFSELVSLRFEYPRSEAERAKSKQRNLALLRDLVALPQAMTSASQSLSGAKSKRLQQLAWLAQSAGRNGDLLMAIEEIKPLIDKAPEHVSFEEVEKAVKIASSLGDCPALEDARFVGETLNATMALTSFAKERGWAHFPTVLDRDPVMGPILEIEGGHAPRVLSEKGAESVSNTVIVGGTNPNTLIVTGPNAKGKSTYLRMAAQNLLLAQMGLPVPSQNMRFTPMSTYFHVNPSDAPSQNMSLFVKQSEELRKKVYARIEKDPFQLIILDEILPGTIPEIRTAAETVFLRRLSTHKPITLVATHNWGTTKLEEENSRAFRNLHVSNYSVLQGAQQDFGEMITGAAEALKQAGWSVDEIAEFKIEAERQRPK